MMREAAVGGRKPCLFKFEKAGDAVFWCACGKSARQPFCDGSHKGTDFSPMRFVARHDGEEMLFCACKRTKTPPYCDGSHNALGAYAEDSGGAEIDWSRAEIAGRSHGAFGRADLDGGCYVLTPDPKAGELKCGWRILPAITREDGADKLSQIILRPVEQNPLALSFGPAETVLFVAAGDARIDICDRTFDAPRYSALTVRGGESFIVRPRGDLAPVIVATVCPPQPPRFNESGIFDSRFPNRLIDAAEKQPMGDRFYQVLTPAGAGADQVTQFIGGIPKSRAAAHRHLYEETLIILSGEGVMWTQARKASVGPGDIIYLPRKQIHSLESVSDGGIVLAGSFFPAGSPAVNY